MVNALASLALVSVLDLPYFSFSWGVYQNDCLIILEANFHWMCFCEFYHFT